MNLVTRTVAASQRSVTQVKPVFQPPPVFSRLYFRMQLFELLPTGQVGQDDARKMAEVIEPGKTYILQVVADPDSDHRTSEHQVTVFSDIELRIQCQHGLIHEEAAPYLVKQDQALSVICEYRIEVDHRYMDDEVTVELSYLRVGRSSDAPTPISELRLQGKNTRVREQFPLFYASIAANLGEGVAVLHAKPQTETTLDIKIYWDGVSQFNDTIVKPTVSPARFMLKNHQPRDIIDLIKNRSAPIRFERWLKIRLHEYGDRFSLLIFDESDEYDMAWELIHVHVWPEDAVPVDSRFQGKEVPIGALFPIVRWIPKLEYHGHDQVPIVPESIVSGDIVAYLDPEDISYVDVEKQMLLRFRGSLFETIHAFKQRLENSLTNTGLIYMGCHGRIIVDSDQEQEFFLGSLSPEQQIKPYNLAGLEYRNPKDSRPLVIINACHSAYTVRKERIRYGLPVTLLRRIARSFIGTIGPVDSEFAATFIKSLLTRASEDSGMRLAFALKEKRAEALRRVQQHKEDDNVWFDYLFTFMYVYYGNPYTTLRLLPPEAVTDEVTS